MSVCMVETLHEASHVVIKLFGYVHLTPPSKWKMNVSCRTQRQNNI